MVKGIPVVVFPVKDLEREKALFSKLLGVEPYVASGFYVGFKVGDQEIGLDPNGHKSGLTGPISYLTVDDIKASLQLLTQGGGQIIQDARNVGGGMLVASGKDLDGNVFGFRQNPKS